MWLQSQNKHWHSDNKMSWPNAKETHPGNVAPSSSQHFLFSFIAFHCFSILIWLFNCYLSFCAQRKEQKKTQAIVVVPLLKSRNNGPTETGSILLLMTHLCSIIITDDNRIARNCFICRFKWALTPYTWILNGSSLLRGQTPNTIIALWNSSATCSRQRSRNLQGFGQAALKVL